MVQKKNQEYQQMLKFQSDLIMVTKNTNYKTNNRIIIAEFFKLRFDWKKI